MACYCPICKTEFFAFEPIAPKKPRRGKCPSCGSVERHRFFYLLRDQLLPAKGPALHFAPEPWLINDMRNQYGAGYVRADYEYPPMDVRLDIEALPFRAETFSLVMCFGVLEHIRNDDVAMAELGRVLKRDGRALIHVPLQFQTHSTWRERLGPVQRRNRYGQSNHLRYYGLDITEQLGPHFQSVRVITPSDQFDAEQMRRLGLVDASRLIVCDR